MSADEAASIYALLGNLTLMSAKKNVAIGNSPFSDKVKTYKDSEYTITNSLEKYGDKFDLKQIRDRQAELAKLAVKAWPLTFR